MLDDFKYQLRAHLYQARAIVGSDSSGLSDPYAVVTIGNFSATSQVGLYMGNPPLKSHLAITMYAKSVMHVIG